MAAQTQTKTAVLEAGISADHHGVADSEVVVMPEIGVKTLVWNSTAAPGTEMESRLFPLSDHCLLCALWRV
jgi:hypothetical protein